MLKRFVCLIHVVYVSLDNAIFDKIFHHFTLPLTLCHFIDRKDLSDLLLRSMVCKVMTPDDLLVTVVA